MAVLSIFRRSGYIISIVGALITITLSAIPALAASSGGSQGASISAVAHVSAATPGTITFVPANTSGASATPALPVITCTPKYSAPHISTHVPTEINSVGTMSCTHAVASIVIAIHLESSNFTQAGASNTCRNAGKSSNSCQVNLTCYPNTTYGGGVSMTATAPSGYEPPTYSYSTSGSFKVVGFC